MNYIKLYIATIKRELQYIVIIIWKAPIWLCHQIWENVHT